MYNSTINLLKTFFTHRPFFEWVQKYDDEIFYEESLIKIKKWNLLKHNVNCCSGSSHRQDFELLQKCVDEINSNKIVLKYHSSKRFNHFKSNFYFYVNKIVKTFFYMSSSIF